MPRITSLTQADQDALFLEFVQEIHAGFPSPAADCAGERIDIARELTSHPETTFYARVSGDSMHDAGLFDGDIIVIDKSLEPHNGDIIIAAVDGEFTVKEFRRDDDNKGGWLIPHNPAILVSSINMLLRDDEFDTLEQLCYYFNREPEELLQTLRQEGYEYNPTLRQFRAV